MKIANGKLEHPIQLSQKTGKHEKNAARRLLV